MFTTSQRSTRAGRTSGRTSSTTTRREEESRTRYSINTGQPGDIDLLSVTLRSGEWPPSAAHPLGGSFQHFRISIGTAWFTQEHSYAQNGTLACSLCYIVVTCRGVELRGDTRDMSPPISSDYHTVLSNNFDQTIKYICFFFGCIWNFIIQKLRLSVVLLCLHQCQKQTYALCIFFHQESF